MFRIAKKLRQVGKCSSTLGDFTTSGLRGNSASLCSHRYASSSSTSGQEAYTIRTENNGIRNIFLNDPKKKNALSLAMLQSLKADLLHEIESEDLRVIIISAGGNVFSAGHNLRELTAEEGKDNHVTIFNSCSEVMTLIPELPVPVIAQVQGLATAAGCQLVASCDIAIAAQSSRFATPGVNVGLFCSTPGVALGRAVPRKVAMEMLFTGDPISSEAALRHGLISKVVPDKELEQETLAVAKKICKSSRVVIAVGKAGFNSQMKKDIHSAYRQTGNIMVDNLGLKDGQEGIKAFIEKRHPVWTHTMDTIEK